MNDQREQKQSRQDRNLLRWLWRQSGDTRPFATWRGANVIAMENEAAEVAEENRLRYGPWTTTPEGVDKDSNPICFRFISSQECPRHTLQQTDIYVPWLDYTIREYSHCQQTTNKMVNIWIQDPYCWLQCDQLVEACQGTNRIKDFWFKLWHALDKWETEANSRTRRIFAAHELPVPRLPHQAPLDTHLQDQIVQKIQKMQPNIRRDDLRPWQAAINTLTAMFAQWPNWKSTIDMILAHQFANRHKEDKHILICYYKWTDEPVLVNSEGHTIRSKNYCWGHATDPSSALQIALAGGIRPASTVDENNALSHWCPSFYCRIDGQRSVHPTEYQHNHSHEEILAIGPQTIHLS